AMSANRDSYPADDKEFLRGVGNRPFDALTAVEFMRVWGIANRLLSGPLDEGYPGIAHDFEKMRAMLLKCREEFCWHGNTGKTLSAGSYGELVDQIDAVLESEPRATKESP